jgi:alkanesulfonate monooxygenase SsuD/methylene tetrahydromethanopterin reductase-like flavin-dependent oxidoreductase (luciferase family)
MDVYLLSFGDYLPDAVSGHCCSQRQRLRCIIETAVLAEEVGFTGVAIGEHHFSQYIVSSPELLLAAIATRTTRVRLATAVTLLAQADPVRVAEQLNTLDALSAGRAEITVARGVSRSTWAAFGLADEDAVRHRFDENLRLLLRLLTEDNVTWQGPGRAPLDAVGVQPRPVQSPRPPIWMGGGLSMRSADLAAEHLLPLMLPSTLRHPDSHLSIVRHYRQRMRGHEAQAGIGIPVHVLVAPSDAEARTRWPPYLESYARFASTLRGTGQPWRVSDLLRGPAICGDPATVAARLLRLQGLLGLDRVLVVFDAGGLPPDQVLAGVELFGTQVLPLLSQADYRHAGNDAAATVATRSQ